MSTTFAPQAQGWLMKQRHGIRKSWVRRYFVLEGNELRYYKSETESMPQNVLHLNQYQIVTDAIPPLPSILKKQPSRQYTFFLLSNDKNERSDMFLQAETKEELDIWVSALEQQQMHGSTSVLDKWLERLDMHTNSSAIPPPLPSGMDRAGSSTSSLLSPQPQRRPTLRGHRSSESLASSLSSSNSMSTSTRSSFGELRRTSNPSTVSSTSSAGNTHHHHTNTSNKFLSNLFNHWSTRPKSPARSTSPPPPPLPSSTQLACATASAASSASLKRQESCNVAPVMPIIHPSEYNRCYKDVHQQNRSRSSSIASRRNVPVTPIVASSSSSSSCCSATAMVRGRSCSSAVFPGETSSAAAVIGPTSSSPSLPIVVDRFPRALTTPALDNSV